MVTEAAVSLCRCSCYSRIRPHEHPDWKHARAICFSSTVVFFFFYLMFPFLLLVFSNQVFWRTCLGADTQIGRISMLVYIDMFVF